MLRCLKSVAICPGIFRLSDGKRGRENWKEKRRELHSSDPYFVDVPHLEFLLFISQ